jgi:hypothetical protein
LSAREESRVVREELPVCEVAAGAGDGEVTEFIANHDQDLQNVLASQLHDEGDDPWVRGTNDLLQVALPDPAVAVP